ncbi:MAG: hypothetical protein HOW97_28835 [Catenulispora sp.]|nr:hypothetical protein [Catenulispora sp.]
MAQGDDADRDAELDGVYGLELVPDIGEEPKPDAIGGLSTAPRETIGGSRARRIPRALRPIGLLVIAAVVATALWPSPKSKPAPADVRIRVAGAALAPSGRIATLTLVLANDAAAAASVGDAEVQDADGHRIGADRQWPAGDIPPGSTLSVDIPVPYVCDTHLPQRLPIALHVSVSSPLDSGTPRNLSYPLDPQAWEKFERYQSGVCDAGGPAAVTIGAIAVAGTDPTARSVRILVPVSVGAPLTVDGIHPANQAFRVAADPAPPLSLPSSGWQVIATTWQVPDCARAADQWDKHQSLLLTYEGPTGGTSVTIPVPAAVVAQLRATACPR